MAKTPIILPENTWTTSDSHWGHNNIIGFCDRPNEHEERMIMRWNEAVPDDGIVLHLGDLSWKNNGYFKNIIAPNLKGAKKYIILGNHDKQRYSFYRDAGFQIVSPFEQSMHIGGKDVMVGFSHYPLREPMGKHYIHIHGHIHNNGYGGVDHPFAPFAKGQINMSVEQTHYTPVNLYVLLDAYLNGCYEEPRKYDKEDT